MTCRFHKNTTPLPGVLRDVSATLPGGRFLTVQAMRHSDRVEVGFLSDAVSCWTSLSAEQARAMAAELLAAADARDAAQMEAVK